jgi:hypothetical protein
MCDIMGPLVVGGSLRGKPLNNLRELTVTAAADPQRVGTKVVASRRILTDGTSGMAPRPKFGAWKILIRKLLP